MDKEFEEPSQILPPTENLGSLYLGNRKTAESLERLQFLEIAHVVNAAPAHVKPSEEMRKKITYFECDLQDSMKFKDGEAVFDDVIPFIEPVVKFIKETIEAGNNVLVHCAGGISRSATICLAFLMLYTRAEEINNGITLPMNLAKALRLIKSVRPIIAPNAGFIKQLLSIENEVFGETSVENPKSVHQRTFKIKDGY